MQIPPLRYGMTKGGWDTTVQDTLSVVKARLLKLLLVVVILAAYPLCGIYFVLHPVRYRGPAWIVVSSVVPVLLALCAAAIGGKLREAKASPLTATGVRGANFGTALLFVALLPAVAGAYGYAFLLACIFAEKKHSTLEWMANTRRPLLHLAMFLPAMILMYYLISSGAPKSGLYVAVCCSFVMLTSPLTGMGIERGVLQPYRPEDPNATPSFVLTCALIFATSFGAIHYAISSLDKSAYSNLKHWHDALYFSVVTMATVGYGDIVPISPFARVACMLEVVASFILLVVAVNASFAAWSVKDRNAERNKVSG